MNSKILEFIPEKIVRKRIGGKLIECLSYSLITVHGEFIEGGLISLDKQWFKACRGPKTFIGKYVKVEYYTDIKKYGFADPEEGKDKPYTLYTEIIEMVDFVVSNIVEQQVLGCDPILDLNTKRFYTKG